MRTGTTLLELVVVLLLLSVLGGSAAPSLARARDRAAVLQARERLVSALRDTRTTAVERGGARLMVRARPPAAWVVAGADTVRTIRWTPDTGAAEAEGRAGGARGRAGTQAGTCLRIGRGATHAEVPFDGTGTGRFANLTVAFTRGDQTASVVVSSYGRIRRR